MCCSTQRAAAAAVLLLLLHRCCRQLPRCFLQCFTCPVCLVPRYCKEECLVNDQAAHATMCNHLTKGRQVRRWCASLFGDPSMLLHVCAHPHLLDSRHDWRSTRVSPATCFCLRYATKSTLWGMPISSLNSCHRHSRQHSTLHDSISLALATSRRVCSLPCTTPAALPAAPMRLWEAQHV